MTAHAHLRIALPPEVAVSQRIGFLRRKSAITISRQFESKERNLTGEHIWVRGYVVSPIGVELANPCVCPQDDKGPDREKVLGSPAYGICVTNPGDRL